MLVTINISKGWKTWSEMAKGLEPQMNEQGAKMLWAGANPDETAVYVLAEMKDPSFVKSFGERPDIVAIREAAGADVASTTPLTQIDQYFMGQDYKSKVRLICEGGYINTQPRAMSLPQGGQSVNKYAKESLY